MRRYTDTLHYKLDFKEDILPLIGYLLNPFSHNNSKYIYRLSAWFKYNFSNRYAFLLSTFEDAVYALVELYGIKRGDKVAVSALADTELIYPLVKCGVSIEYVDVNKRDYAISPSILRKTINKDVKMIIVSHTYGIASSIDTIRKIAKSKKIILIEDCRDSIGIKWKNKKLGTFSDAAIFGFGYNRVISPLPGGVILTHIKKTSENLKKLEQTSPYPSGFWIYYQLLYALISYILQNTFSLHEKIGQFLFSTTMTFRLFSRPILKYEQSTYNARQKIKRMPESLAFMALQQLTHLSQINKSKKLFYKEMKKNLPRNIYRIPMIDTSYFQIPIYTPHIDRIKRMLRRRGFTIPQWYNRVIKEKNKAVFYNYTIGSCKTAEDLMRYSIELPSLHWGRKEQLDDILMILKKVKYER